VALAELKRDAVPGAAELGVELVVAVADAAVGGLRHVVLRSLAAVRVSEPNTLKPRSARGRKTSCWLYSISMPSRLIVPGAFEVRRKVNVLYSGSSA
jgi:hypothetical protein